MLQSLLGIGVVIMAYFVVLACYSHYKKPQLGLTESGVLKACGAKPNCVCSDHAVPTSPSHIAMPLQYGALNADRAWQQLLQAIEQSGGVVQSTEGYYVWATYQSRLFRYVDDLEARLDTTQKVIHLRSASRVGYSDLGANAARIEQIRALFAE